MSLQGPLIVVAEQPATDLVEALGAAGAFPIVEAKWTDAPTAFVAVKPCAMVIAEPGSPPSETSARMLCLQVATASGPIVPVLAATQSDCDAAIPIALPYDADAPVDRLIARLRAALRVRALHATVLRRIENFGADHGHLPSLPVGDAFDDATVLVAGRGPLYPALSTALGERVKMVGALSVESAAQHLAARDIDGVVIGDGFSAGMIEALLKAMDEDGRFRDLPVAVVGDKAAGISDRMANVDQVDGEPARLLARMVPRIRLHAQEARFARMLKALETEGMIDPDTGLMSHDAFWTELNKALAEAATRGHALSVARFAFEGAHDRRAALDSARLMARLIRNIDFACREDDGTIFMVLTQTDLRSAHIVARRIAAALKKALLAPEQTRITAHITLATLKAGDTVESLLSRVVGAHTVAAE